MRYFEKANKHICPECGGPMSEVERVNEDGFTFIWYKCVRVNCAEQWLEKRAVSHFISANLAKEQLYKSA